MGVGTSHFPIGQSVGELPGSLWWKVTWVAQWSQLTTHGPESHMHIQNPCLPAVESLDARFNSHPRLQARYSSRFLLPTHHPKLPHGAHIVSWDLSVPTISSDKGSDTSPPPPPVESQKRIDRWNGLLGQFSGFLFRCTHQVFIISLGIFSMYSVGFAKLVTYYRFSFFNYRCYLLILLLIMAFSSLHSSLSSLHPHNSTDLSLNREAQPAGVLVDSSQLFVA